MRTAKLTKSDIALAATQAIRPGDCFKWNIEYFGNPVEFYPHADQTWRRMRWYEKLQEPSKQLGDVWYDSIYAGSIGGASAPDILLYLGYEVFRNSLEVETIFAKFLGQVDKCAILYMPMMSYNPNSLNTNQKILLLTTYEEHFLKVFTPVG